MGSDEKIIAGITTGILAIATIMALKNRNRKKKEFSDEKDIIREASELKEARKTAHQLTVDPEVCRNLETIATSFEHAYKKCKRMEVAQGLIKIETDFYNQYNFYMIQGEEENGRLFVENMMLKLQVRNLEDYIRDMKSERIFSALFNLSTLKTIFEGGR